MGRAREPDGAAAAHGRRRLPVHGQPRRLRRPDRGRRGRPHRGFEQNVPGGLRPAQPLRRARASTPATRCGTGTPVDRLLGYRWDADAKRFVQIPFQVDEQFTRYLDNTASGFALYSGQDQHTTYAFDREGFRWHARRTRTTRAGAPPSTPTAADPVAGLDHERRARVHGHRRRPAGAGRRAKLPDGHRAARAHHASPTRRTPPRARYVYVGARRRRTARSPRSTRRNGYVRYKRDANADTFAFSRVLLRQLRQRAKVGTYCDDGNGATRRYGEGRRAPARHRDDHHQALPLPLRRPLADDEGRDLARRRQDLRPRPRRPLEGARVRAGPRAPRRRAAATRRRTPTGAARRRCSARGSARCARSARRGAPTPARTSSAARPSTATRCSRRRGCACTSSRRSTASTRSGTSTPAASTRSTTRAARRRAIDGRNDEVFGNFDDPCNPNYDAQRHERRSTRATARSTSSCSSASFPYHLVGRPGRPDVRRPQRGHSTGAWSPAPHGSIVDRITTSTSRDQTPGGAAQSRRRGAVLPRRLVLRRRHRQRPGPEARPALAATSRARAPTARRAQCWTPDGRRPDRQRPLLPGLDRHARPAPAVPRRLRQRAADRAADRDRQRVADGHAARRAAPRPPASGTAARSRSRRRGRRRPVRRAPEAGTSRPRSRSAAAESAARDRQCAALGKSARVRAARLAQARAARGARLVGASCSSTSATTSASTGRRTTRSSRASTGSSRTRTPSSCSARPTPTARPRASRRCASATGSGGPRRTACSRTSSCARRRAAPAWGARSSRPSSTLARERGCRRVELDANDENAAAQALYRSFGFDAQDDRYGGRNLFMRLHLRRSRMTAGRAAAAAHPLRHDEPARRRARVRRRSSTSCCATPGWRRRSSPPTPSGRTSSRACPAAATRRRCCCRATSTSSRRPASSGRATRSAASSSTGGSGAAARST